MKNGYKTKLKAEIAELFRAREQELLSAADIYKILSERGVSINLTTVYRNLDAMTADGELLRFTDGERGQTAYKYSGDGGSCRGHLHLRCTECGEVVHLDCGFMAETTLPVKPSATATSHSVEGISLGSKLPAKLSLDSFRSL